MSHRQIGQLLCGVLVLGLMLCAGCYESDYPLGKPDPMDPAYVGNYTGGEKDAASKITIRNFDGKQYYVDVPTKDGDALRFAGYTSEIGGITFANLRLLTDDGSLSKTYLIMRVSLSDDHATLTMRDLNSDFFKDKNIDSSNTLRKVIENNLNNDAMYDKDTSTATRVVKQQPPTPPQQ